MSLTLLSKLPCQFYSCIFVQDESQMSFVIQSIYSDTPLQSVVVRVIIQIFSALARLCSKSSLPFQLLIRSRQPEWISLIPKSKFTGRESRRDHQTSWFYFWFYSAASHLIHLSSLYVPPTSTLQCIPRRSLTSNQVINKHKAKNPAKEPLQNNYNHLLSSGLIYFRVSRIHYLVRGKTIVYFGPRIASPTQIIVKWSQGGRMISCPRWWLAAALRWLHLYATSISPSRGPDCV